MVAFISAEPPPAGPIGYGRPFTRADLEDVPNDGRRYELVDGVLIVSAAPGRMHQRAVLRMAKLLDDACPARFEVMIAPFAVGLAVDTGIQPDLLVALRDELTGPDLPGAPALVVEVLSPSSRLIDLNVKRERFERAGTRSFWAVDPLDRPEEARLIAWELGPGRRYQQVADVTGDDEFRASLPCPVTVVPAELVR
jgi:Uma2 family endonuclease